MIRLTYVGHSTVQIEALGLRLLTDPVLRPRVLHLRRIVPLRPHPGLREPDAVLISHAQIDHLDVPSLRRVRSCRVLAPAGTRRTLARAGMTDVSELRPGDSASLGPIEVTAIQMEHRGGRHPLVSAHETLGYLIDCTVRILFIGDTDLFEGMRELAGKVDVALIPIWGWGPRVDAGHMDPDRAARAVEYLQPRIAIPIHWGTLASPNVWWRRDPQAPAREFKQRAGELAPEVDVRVLEPGTSTQVVIDPGAASS